MTHGRCAACWLHAVRSFRGSFASIPIPTLEPPTPRSSLYSCHHAFPLQCLVSSWSLDKARPVQIPLLHPAGKPTRWRQSLPHLVQAESHRVPTWIHQQLLSSLPSNYIATSCISPRCAPQPGYLWESPSGAPSLGLALLPKEQPEGAPQTWTSGPVNALLTACRDFLPTQEDQTLQWPGPPTLHSSPAARPP